MPAWENVRESCFRLSRRAFQIWRQQGVRGLGRKTLRKLQAELRKLLRRTQLTESASFYQTWIGENEPGNVELLEQTFAARDLAYRPLISILTPVFDPDPAVLLEGILSVLTQTYDRWELCLVEGGSSNEAGRKLLEREALGDERIKVKFLPENRGIAGNTNEALALARGDYVALLDHDDLLAPQALYEVVRLLNERPDLEMIYTDEDRIDAEGKRCRPFFKPAWSPDLLHSFMYVGHLTVYRRSTLLRVGPFDPKCELSQDYDMALRVSEATHAIAHLPMVLYHWRAVQGSAAAGDKPHARASNLRALTHAVRRRGYQGTVLEYPSANRINFHLEDEPLVSIVIPSDSEENIRRCLKQIGARTHYRNREILVVTNSPLAGKLHRELESNIHVEWVLFDRPYSFSAKCNEGARAAQGEYLIFLNDDVEPVSEDWVEAMLQLFQRQEVGAVAPKLVYTDGTIQHAGLVTGVRDLVGTAFHKLPAESCDYFNFIQSTRNVSALTAACLAIPRKVFEEIDGFDEQHTPIMHSDVDLCFKIRDLGLLLVYTPFATLKHIGHASIGKLEEEKPLQDRADLWLLKKWGGYVSRDPYYPEAMRQYLYTESPAPYTLSATNDCGLHRNRADLLMITHELSFTGAPLILHDLARYFWSHGFFVTVCSPVDGPLREAYEKLGIPVLIDPLVATAPTSLHKFFRNFDVILANTIHQYQAVLAARAVARPCLWFVHESKVGVEMARSPRVGKALAGADAVIFPSRATQRMYRHRLPGKNHHVLYYGLDFPTVEGQPAVGEDAGRLRLLQVGSIEPRKGQDVLLNALSLLPPESAHRFETALIGKVLPCEDRPDFYGDILNLAKGLPGVHFLGEQPPARVRRHLQSIDVLVCTSRDETGPICVLEAMAAGKCVVSTPVGVVPEAIEDQVSGLIVPPDDPHALAAALLRLDRDRDLLRRLAAEGEKKFRRSFTLDRYGLDVLTFLTSFLPAGQARRAVPGEAA